MTLISTTVFASLLGPDHRGRVDLTDKGLEPVNRLIDAADVEYIERRSISFDIQLLARTLLSVISRQGAY